MPVWTYLQYHPSHRSTAADNELRSLEGRMSRRILATLVGLAIITLAFGFVAIAEAVRGQKDRISPPDTRATIVAKPWKSPRTPWGHPDLQGIWDYRTITPLERPSALSGKSVLTDDE